MTFYKKIIFFCGIVISVFFLFSLLAFSFSKDQFMAPEKAREKWGNVEFNAEKFKAGDSMVRASMAASLVSTKAFVGIPLNAISEKLGPSTGYYFSKMIPAYAIGDLSHGRTETWQLILIPDDDSKVIKEIKIHKKCCKK